jgi:hypothetical protein
MADLDDTRGQEANGEDDRAVLQRFRRFASGHVDDFLAARDRVGTLIGDTQRYLTGVAREDLLRHFLRRLLPGAFSVDSGVVYGFEKEPSSDQIDVLVWNSATHPAIFRAENFVIVPPEAVLAAISVKTHSSRVDILDTAKNLVSLAPLEFTFRSGNLPPILKIGFFYSHETQRSTTCGNIASALAEVVEDSGRAQDLLAILRRCCEPRFDETVWEE